MCQSMEDHPRCEREWTLAVSKGPAAWHFPDKQVPPKPVRYEYHKKFRLHHVITHTTGRSVDKQGSQSDTFLWIGGILTWYLTCCLIIGTGRLKPHRSPDSLTLYWPWVSRADLSIPWWWLDRSRDNSQATDVHWPLAHAKPLLPQLWP